MIAATMETKCVIKKELLPLAYNITAVICHPREGIAYRWKDCACLQWSCA